MSLKQYLIYIPVGFCFSFIVVDWRCRIRETLLPGRKYLNVVFLRNQCTKRRHGCKPQKNTVSGKAFQRWKQSCERLTLPWDLTLVLKLNQVHTCFTLCFIENCWTLLFVWFRAQLILCVFCVKRRAFWEIGLAVLDAERPCLLKAGIRMSSSTHRVNHKVRYSEVNWGLLWLFSKN